MKTAICDICGQVMKEGYQKRREFKAKLSKGEAIMPFLFAVEVVSFNFCTTDFDVCDDCVLGAIKKALT